MVAIQDPVAGFGYVYLPDWISMRSTACHLRCPPRDLSGANLDGTDKGTERRCGGRSGFADAEWTKTWWATESPELPPSARMRSSPRPERRLPSAGSLQSLRHRSRYQNIAAGRKGSSPRGISKNLSTAEPDPALFRIPPTIESSTSPRARHDLKSHWGSPTPLLQRRQPPQRRPGSRIPQRALLPSPFPTRCGCRP